MKVVHDFSGECKDGVNTYLDLEEFADDSQSIVLFYGIDCTLNKELQEQYKHYNRRILLDLWSPCDLYSPNDTLGQDHFDAQDYFTDVYCICPYTVHWSNLITKSKKWKYVFYPWQPRIAPTNFEKKYDVCFVGGIHSAEHENALQVIEKYNYRFISQQLYPGVTNFNVSTQEKLDIIAQCKVTICFNLLYLTEQQTHFALNNYNLNENYAFARLQKIGNKYTVPQFKSRLHEAAIGKSLILCREDDWGLINSYYAQNEALIFKPNSLEESLNQVLEHYEKIGPFFTENAYKKAQNFTTKRLIQYIQDTL